MHLACFEAKAFAGAALLTLAEMVQHELVEGEGGSMYTGVILHDKCMIKGQSNNRNTTALNAATH